MTIAATFIGYVIFFSLIISVIVFFICFKRYSSFVKAIIISLCVFIGIIVAIVGGVFALMAYIVSIGGGV